MAFSSSKEGSIFKGTMFSARVNKHGHKSRRQDELKKKKKSRGFWLKIQAWV